MSSVQATNSRQVQDSKNVQISSLAGDQYVYTKWQGRSAIAKASHVSESGFVQTREFLAPTTAINTNAFVNATNFDLKIPKKGAFRLKNLAIRIRLNNTDGSNTVTPTIACYWFSRIEIRAGAGNKLLQTIYPQQLFWATMFMPVLLG